MSMDRSLKSKSTLVRHRNVLSRAERILQMQELGTWTEANRPYGLPKVSHRKAKVGKKAAKEKKPTEGAEAGAAAAAPAEPAPKEKEKKKKE